VKEVIVPDYKEGDTSDCNNYHGILLLSTSYKIVSNILLSGLSPYIGEDIGDHQRRFRRNRSTTDYIFRTHQILGKQRGRTKEYPMYRGIEISKSSNASIFHYNLDAPDPDKVVNLSILGLATDKIFTNLVFGVQVHKLNKERRLLP
jgi:hypothetical protein